MPVEVIGMRGIGTGGAENAIASLDIPQDGVITGIDWDGRADVDADGEVIEAELSFIATAQFGTNDVRGRLSSVGAQISLTTSGVAHTSLQKFVGPTEIPVAGGERLHLHLNATAGLSSTIRVNIHLDVGRSRDVRRRSARRR